MHTLESAEAQAALNRFVTSTRRALFYMDSQPDKARKILANMLESVGANVPEVSATCISDNSACSEPACKHPFCTGAADYRHLSHPES